MSTPKPGDWVTATIPGMGKAFKGVMLTTSTTGKNEGGEPTATAAHILDLETRRAIPAAASAITPIASTEAPGDAAQVLEDSGFVFDESLGGFAPRVAEPAPR